MPTYEYHCEECDFEMELFHKITDKPQKKCPRCSNETLRRGPGGGIGLSFKGSGFYITDYGPKKECCSKSPSKEKACSCAKKESSE